MSKLIYGVAYNSKGIHKTRTGKKMSLAYRTWFNMILRCYSKNESVRKAHQTYIDCKVKDTWLDYQNFAEWYSNHDFSDLGYDLDKDILIPNSKLYSPETCCFVPQEINKLLTDSKSARKVHPQGVSFNKPMGKYFANIKIDGRKQHLGYFDCPQEAHQVYKIAKEANVKRMALEWQDRIASDVFDALMRWSLDS